MKLNPSVRRAPLCLVASVLVAAGATTTALAAAPPALLGQVVARPVTPGDKTVYGLPASLEVSGGLSTVGVGTPVYLEAEINNAVPASDIVGVTWVLTNQPIGSVAVLGTSPLGTNVPVYEPADRVIYQVAGRTLLRPDLKGQYTVMATITTGSSGTTNVSFTLTAAAYMGINTCFLCHSGGAIAPDKSSWQRTAHASIFTKGIDGNLGIGAFYSKSCLACHTVGYDTNTNAVDGGFDDIMTQLGWVFPTVITNGNWANLQTNYPALANLANIQCENCHGPGSEHAYGLGDTNRISKTVASGDCNQCHDAPTHHVKGTEWYSSLHASTTRDPSGSGREGCVICHTGQGFIDRISGASTTNTTYSAIGCQTCHEPHGETTPTNNLHLVRTLASVKLMDGTTVTNAGMGALCMNCHHSRQNATNYVETANPSSHFGPHHGPQADMLMGVNGVTYGQVIPSSAHRDVVGDTCATCHMQTVNPTDYGFLHVGGHTFKPSWDGGGGTNAPVDLTGACIQCHGQIASFDFPRQDYDGDGIVEGVQTEVQHLLDKLGMMLPPVGTAKSTINITTNWTRQQLRAGYNYLFVQSDGSRGIHNLAYTVGLLKASIADLTGDANHDGLPDAWQIQYFGSITNANAAPDADPAGDGVPNWLKYSLGLDPTIPAVAFPGGVVLANGKNLVNPPANGETNGIAIYTAAEVAFNTEVGLTYQLQSVSSLSEGWQNVGSPIPGTGAPVSYVTPTRKNVQQYFRVVHTP